MYDAIIVGAGIMGSATTYQLAKRGKSVLLLEQFPLPHTRGSSHGQTRIFRNGYPQEHLAQMASAAGDAWRRLEDESSTPLLSPCGVLLFGDSREAKSDFVAESQRRIRQFGRRAEALVSEAMRKRWRGIAFGENDVGVLDEEAGVLRADAALRTFQSLAVKNGAEIRDAEPATSIEDNESGVVIKTSKGSYSARRAVLTPGPWAAPFLKSIGVDLPLKTMRVQVCYWREKEPGAYANYPAFIDAAPSPEVATDIYGLPSAEYPGCVKVCLHWGVEAWPETRDSVGNEGDVEILKRFVAKRLPLLDSSSPCITEACMYTVTPDKDFVIGRVPPSAASAASAAAPSGNVYYAAGFSGTGFKMSPIVGEILADLVMGVETEFDVSRFSPERF